MEENAQLDLTGEDNIPVEISKGGTKKAKNPIKVKESAGDSELINCLRNEIVTVRYIPKMSGMVTDPKHVFYGGMAENATRAFTVPILESNGQYFNVLTNNEKAFLENIMGLEYNALSIYLKENNYWDNFVVRLSKGDNFLDLSNPTDYIKYKVLLANKDFIAPSITALQDTPRATYQYVITSEQEEAKQAKRSLSATKQAYIAFGKIEEDIYSLRTAIEILDGRPTASTTKLDFLQTQINRLIQADAKMFLKVVEDPYFPAKVLIKKAVEAALISRRGDFYYLKEDNSPLCENGEDPTFSVAARYLSNPKRQTLKLSLEAKLK